MRRQAAARCASQALAGGEAGKGLRKAAQRNRPVGHRAAVDAAHLGAEAAAGQVLQHARRCAPARDGRGASSRRWARPVHGGRQHGGMLARAVVVERRRRRCRDRISRARRCGVHRLVHAAGQRRGVRPARCSIDSASAVWAGVPECEAQASAISRVAEAEAVGGAGLEEGIACSGLMAERGKTGAATSPTAATSSPVGRATASAPACTLSTSAPRVSSMRMGLRMRSVPGGGPGAPVPCNLRPHSAAREPPAPCDLRAATR